MSQWHERIGIFIALIFYDISIDAKFYLFVTAVRRVDRSWPQVTGVDPEEAITRAYGSKGHFRFRINAFAALKKLLQLISSNSERNFEKFVWRN